jgi:hypothetical protein
MRDALCKPSLPAILIQLTRPYVVCFHETHVERIVAPIVAIVAHQVVRRRISLGDLYVFHKALFKVLDVKAAGV